MYVKKNRATRGFIQHTQESKPGARAVFLTVD